MGANDDNNTGVYPRPLVLALGSESRGLSENILNACDLLLRIPGFGDSTKLNQCLSQSITSSLNVSVAAGILLYQLTMFRHGHEAVDKSSFISHTE